MADQDFQINIRTTADAAGIAEIEAKLQQLKTQVAATPPAVPPIPGPVFGAEGAAIAGGVIGTAAIFAAKQVYEAVKDASEEIAKINKDVGDQVILLDKASQKWTEIARSATSAEDVTKLAGAVIPLLEKVADKNREVAAQTITTKQGVIELLLALNNPVATLALGPFRPFTEGLRQAQEEQRKLNEIIQETISREIDLGRASVASFDAKVVASYADAVTQLSGQLKAVRDYQASIDTKPGAGFEARITDYKLTGEKITELERQLKALSTVEKEREAFHKGLFPTIDDDTYKVRTITEALHGMGVQTDNLNKAFSQGLSTAGPLGAVIRSMVLDLLKAQNAVSKTLTADLFKGPVTAFQDSLNRQKEFQAHVSAQRELAAEGVGEEVSAAEKKKFFQEEELRQLQRKQALQRSLLPEGEGPEGAEALKRLGTQGLRDFQERQRRINELQQQLGNVPKRDGQAQSDVAQAIRDNTAAWKAALALWQ